MVFLEAQSTGVPVIGTRAGGIPDAIRESEGGWLVGEDDAIGVRTHLQRLVQDAQAFRTQGKLARLRMCREATWPIFMKKLETALEAIVD